MRNGLNISYKIKDINKEIKQLQNEILECLEYQKQRGERINKNCDYIQNRDIRIYGLEQQKLILKWVLEEDNN